MVTPTFNNNEGTDNNNIKVNSNIDFENFKEKSKIAELENIILRMELEKKGLLKANEELNRELERLRIELERIRIPPLIIGTVTDDIYEDKVVVKSSTGPSFLVGVAGHINRKDLVPGTRICLNQQTLSIVEILDSEKDHRVLAMELEEKPDIDFESIGGLDEQIREVKEVVELPLTNPELFKKVGIDPPKGVLLYGPPGTGKTLLAKAVAKETNAAFIKVVGSELVKKFIGEGAKLVKDIFNLAKERAPAIIFIDEIDAVASKRTETITGGDREVQRTLMQLLAEMDGFDSSGDVKIIGATNRPDILDSAILRPGRFDRIIEVPAPSIEGIKEIYKIHTKNMNLKNVDLNEIAKKSESFVGADIKAVCTEAGMLAIRDRREYVTTEDFIKSIEKLKEGDNEEYAFKEHPSVMYG